MKSVYITTYSGKKYQSSIDSILKGMTDEYDKGELERISSRISVLMEFMGDVALAIVPKEQLEQILTSYIYDTVEIKEE